MEIGDIVVIDNAYEGIIVSFNDDDTVTIYNEATGKRYTVTKDQISTKEE